MRPSYRLSIRCNRGNALIEFGLVFPLLVLILFGVVEMGRYTVIHMKLDKAVNAVADFTTQSSTASASSLDGNASAAPEILKPFAFSGTVIFTGVAFYDPQFAPCLGVTQPCIMWQHHSLGGSPSQVGSPGGIANVPGSYPVPANQNIVVTEIYFSYTPLLSGTGSVIPALAPHSIYKTAVYKPRFPSTLICMNGNCPPP